MWLKPSLFIIFLECWVLKTKIQDLSTNCLNKALFLPSQHSSHSLSLSFWLFNAWVCVTLLSRVAALSVIWTLEWKHVAFKLHFHFTWGYCVKGTWQIWTCPVSLVFSGWFLRNQATVVFLFQILQHNDYICVCPCCLKVEMKCDEILNFLQCGNDLICFPYL